MLKLFQTSLFAGEQALLAATYDAVCYRRCTRLVIVDLRQYVG